MFSPFFTFVATSLTQESVEGVTGESAEDATGELVEGVSSF